MLEIQRNDLEVHVAHQSSLRVSKLGLIIIIKFRMKGDKNSYRGAIQLDHQRLLKDKVVLDLDLRWNESVDNPYFV